MDDPLEQLRAAGFDPFVIDEDTVFPTPSGVIEVSILHKIDSDFWHTTVGEYQLVAVLAAPINHMPQPIQGFLDWAYRNSNHMATDWTTGHWVYKVWPPCRSSSIGDIFVINNRFFVVAPYGFEEV
jgi:hypothetical protein